MKFKFCVGGSLWSTIRDFVRTCYRLIKFDGTFDKFDDGKDFHQTVGRSKKTGKPVYFYQFVLKFEDISNAAKFLHGFARNKYGVKF